MWAGYRSARLRAPAHGGSKHGARSQLSPAHGMNTLVAVLLLVTAVCAIARPGPSPSPMMEPPGMDQEERLLTNPSLGLSSATNLNRLLLRPLMPPYRPFDQRSLRPAAPSGHDWLDEEIERLKKMEIDGRFNTYKSNLGQWIVQDPDIRKFFGKTVVKNVIPERKTDFQSASEDNLKELDPFRHKPRLSLRMGFAKGHMVPRQELPVEGQAEKLNGNKQTFAFSPLEKGFYESIEEPMYIEKPMSSDGPQEGGDSKTGILLEPPRQTRQNPNWSKTKTLVADDLDKLKARLANKDVHKIPVSLLPTNLRWLGVSSVDDAESSHGEGTATSNHAQKLDGDADSESSFYTITLLAAVGAAVTVVVIAFLIGWYSLSKKAKAAADVDYPAYGVTGPSVDSSGDRKLAHSAHMYHYQHQKQQIIAMERNCLEQCTGSVTDPESEEENEEGDYTVYECPGFASTGDMEVKNPLFTEDPTPVTPGNCETDKVQPKK